MVGHLLRLKRDYQLATWRRSPMAVLGAVLMCLYGLGILFAAFSLVMAVRGDGPQAGQVATVLLGSAIALGWLVAPLITAASDPIVDPQVLAPYPLTRGQLMAGQLGALLIGIPGALTALAFFLPLLAWHSVPALVAVLPCLVLGLVLVFVLSRLVGAGALALGARRRVGELISVLLLFAVMMIGPLVGGVMAGLAAVDGFGAAAAVLGWTPLGAAWSVPAQLELGHVGTALAQFVLLLVFLGLALLGWARVVAHQTSHVGAASGQGRTRAARGNGLGLLGRVPASPTWAVAARTAIYFVKDPRFLLNLVAVPGFFVVFWLTGNVVMGSVFPAWIGTWTSTYIVSYDNTAFSLHLTAPLTGRQDRTGRVLAFLLCIGPFGLAAAVASPVLAGSAWAWPMTTGCALCLMLSVLGLGAVLSVRYASPVAPPGGSLWRNGSNGSGAANLGIQLLGMALSVAFLVPCFATMLVFAITHDPLWSWLTLPVGLVTGVVVLLVGLRLGAAWYDRRAPELYEEIGRFRQ